MLQNLAAYTVKDIQVYNKRGMLGELAKADVGDSQYVMDVKLKKEFMFGTTVNAEAGYGSNERYLGRLFGLGITPTGQYSVYFNANNLNDSRKPGQNSGWTPDKMPTGVRKTINGGLDYNIKTRDNHWEVNGNINAETTREDDGTDVTRTNYLASGDRYDYLFNRSHNKSLKLTTKHKVYYKTDKGYGISTEPYLEYQNWNHYAENVNATFDEHFNDVTSDFLRGIYSGNSNAALASIVNREITSNRQKGYSLSTGTNLWQAIKLNGTADMLTLNLTGSYAKRKEEVFNHYDINYGQEATPSQTANRYFKNYPNFNSYLSGELKYTRILTRGMSLGLAYQYSHAYRKETSELYQLGSIEDVESFLDGKLPSAIDYETKIDVNNSYLSRGTDDNHRVTLSYMYNIGSIYLQYRLPLTFARQELSYQRGVVDTTITRRTVLLDIGNAFVQWQTGNHSLFYSWDLKSKAPDLVTMVDFTDDTNPLYITKGNGNLKNALSYQSQLSYRFKNKEKGYQLGAGVNYKMVSNALSRGYTYNTSTGVREASYYNVNGNWNIDGGIHFSKSFKNGLVFGNALYAGHATSVDLVGEDTPQLSRSKVYDLNFADKLILQYELGKHKVALNVDARHDRYTSNLDNFTKQNTWTVKSSLNGTLTLPANFQLSTDFSVYNRRGYTDQALNTDNFVWNARLSYSALKGKLLLMVDGYDILHDLSNVSYTLNAQARTETFRTVLPRYVMFHVQWRLSSSPKGKK